MESKVLIWRKKQNRTENKRKKKEIEKEKKGEKSVIWKKKKTIVSWNFDIKKRPKSLDFKNFMVDKVSVLFEKNIHYKLKRFLNN